jgi:Na+/proline symporter
VPERVLRFQICPIRPAEFWIRKNRLTFLAPQPNVAFTILFGTRHLDATERHEGLVAAIAFESLVKLLAFLAVGVFVAYVSGRALPRGAEYLPVFRFAGCTAFLAYSVALWQDSIWYSRKWSTTIKNTFDGLLYALMTAGTFGWLWPHASP